MPITIYSCGGAGVNLGKQIRDLDATVNFIDTSRSNLNGVNSDNIYIVDAMDGAGKNRAVAYNNFKDTASDVLTRFKPSDQLNIVISSLTGGSGGILAALVTKELISKGHNTIVIGVDSRGSLIELSNSVKTLQTYQSISKQIDQPIPLYYINQPTRSEADREALLFLNLLSLIIEKRRTAEFDNSDLNSFLYFNKTTANNPCVSIIEVVPNEKIVPEKNTSVVCSILVTTKTDSVISPVIPEYLATCVVTDPDYKAEDGRINALLGKLPLIIDNLNIEITALQDSKKINKVREVECAESNADGIVL